MSTTKWLMTREKLLNTEVCDIGTRVRMYLPTYRKVQEYIRRRKVNHLLTVHTATAWIEFRLTDILQNCIKMSVCLRLTRQRITVKTVYSHRRLNVLRHIWVKVNLTAAEIIHQMTVDR